MRPAPGSTAVSWPFAAESSRRPESRPSALTSGGPGQLSCADTRPFSASTPLPSRIAAMRPLTSFVSTSNSSRHSAASPRTSQLPRPSALNARMRPS